MIQILRGNFRKAALFFMFDSRLDTGSELKLTPEDDVPVI